VTVVPLDPNAEAVLQQLAAAGLPPFDAGSVEDARQYALGMASVQGEPERVAKIEDRAIPGPAGEIPVRVYRPERSGPLPALVYFHGGGWVICSLDTHDVTCRGLANATPAVVVSVDYRLAPEHKFPAASEDCYGATRWVAENAAELGVDADAIAVGGDSAGGNLAAGVALMARDHGGPRLAYQLLVYPVIDGRMDSASYRENADGYLLTRSQMQWFWNHYVRGDADRANPYASPILARELGGLPPATVITAEFDPLRDEGEAYAARLREAGVRVSHTRYDGLIHGFFSMAALFPQARPALESAASEMRAVFAARSAT
jgi:acetyl esterase